jgi:hypothetical protein
LLKPKITITNVNNKSDKLRLNNHIPETINNYYEMYSNVYESIGITGYSNATKLLDHPNVKNFLGWLTIPTITSLDTLWEYNYGNVEYTLANGSKTTFKTLQHVLWVLIGIKHLQYNINDTNKYGRKGWTILHYAYYYNINGRHNELIRILIDIGADQNIKNVDGNKPSDLLHVSPSEMIEFRFTPKSSTHNNFKNHNDFIRFALYYCDRCEYMKKQLFHNAMWNLTSHLIKIESNSIILRDDYLNWTTVSPIYVELLKFASSLMRNLNEEHLLQIYCVLGFMLNNDNGENYKEKFIKWLHLDKYMPMHQKIRDVEVSIDNDVFNLLFT